MRFAGLLFLFLTSVSHAHFIKPDVFETETSQLKALVFLSHKCPCSRSHVDHMKSLLTQYTDLKIYGVISEPLEENDSKGRNYFSPDRFPFPIIEDPQQSLVKKYRALKTPHVSLFQKRSNKFELIYEGGLTDQKVFNQSGTFYLAENLEALSKGLKPIHRQGFSLGCYIKRSL
ncbi:MAG: redoxin domain-containing protein [Bdellovibrionales bacterium]|nr:redoxin domain-containing protein [Bdellovibrionales bacterium]NQZ19196.1 redoxin domain-containing protein [Bdellovibrionales bacterium]